MADTEENSDDKATRFKEKHSLDSDEEDEDGKKYDVLADDDIEGQCIGSLYFFHHLRIFKVCPLTLLPTPWLLS